LPQLWFLVILELMMANYVSKRAVCLPFLMVAVCISFVGGQDEGPIDPPSPPPAPPPLPPLSSSDASNPPVPAPKEETTKPAVKEVTTTLSPSQTRDAALQRHNKLLLHGASEGYVEQVKEALANGADVTYAEAHGWTALHLTNVHAPVHHAEIVQALLAKRADPDAKDAIGRTPLIFASLAGLTDSLRVMLMASKKEHPFDPQGRNPLTYAAREGHQGAVKELLAARIDPGSVHLKMVQHNHIRKLLGAPDVESPTSAPAAAEDL